MTPYSPGYLNATFLLIPFIRKYTIVRPELTDYAVLDNLIINSTFFFCYCRRPEFHFYTCHKIIFFNESKLELSFKTPLYHFIFSSYIMLFYSFPSVFKALFMLFHRQIGIRNTPSTYGYLKKKEAVVTAPE